MKQNQNLTLHSNTFLWIKGRKGLLYNADNYATYEFELNQAVEHLCHHMLNYDNLYTIAVDKISPEAGELVETILELEFGYIWDGAGIKHISLPPLFNLQYDYRKIRTDSYLSQGLGVIDYLSTVNIYVGGGTDQDQYYRQIIYPPFSKTALSLSNLETLLQDKSLRYAKDINIIFGLELPIEYITSVVQMAIRLGMQKKVVYQIMASEVELLRSSLGASKITAIVQSDSIGNFGTDGLYGLRLIVRSKAEYALLEEFANQSGHERITFEPVYDNNSQFFEENILLEKSDLLEFRLSKREIFAHMALNIADFGVLTVMPDCSICSGVDSLALGRVGEALSEIIFREMECNYSWRKIRDNEICYGCLYQFLCPSPGSYERVTGRKTVCKI